MLDAEQKELLLAFVEEGNEMLDESEPLFIELESRSHESGQVDGEVINTIFRLFHSLKGGAGFLNLDTVQNVTHEAETLLDLFRKGKFLSHNILPRVLAWPAFGREVFPLNLRYITKISESVCQYSSLTHLISTVLSPLKLRNFHTGSIPGRPSLGKPELDRIDD